MNAVKLFFLSLVVATCGGCMLGFGCGITKYRVYDLPFKSEVPTYIRPLPRRAQTPTPKPQGPVLEIVPEVQEPAPAPAPAPQKLVPPLRPVRREKIA